MLAQRLDRLAEKGVLVLHDRGIPGSRANIDHIAVTPTGVYVIDAKRYEGRPQLRVEGGLLRPRTERLAVGSRDCTKAVAGVHMQIGLVRTALDRTGHGSVPLAGVLCFVEADWPMIGGAFTVEGMHVLWPKKAGDLLLKPGPLVETQLQELHQQLATAFPRPDAGRRRSGDSARHLPADSEQEPDRAGLTETHPESAFASFPQVKGHFRCSEGSDRD